VTERNEWAPPGIDTTVPSIARMYDYYLGGKDNFAVDRAAAGKLLAIAPEIAEISRQNRAFLGRVVRFLTEAGVRQFIDIGTGLPTQNNVHQVAQLHAPESRVVYVDNDPIVLAHAHALLVGTAEGSTTFVESDLRRPDAIVEKAAETLDLTRPVALMLIGLLHVIPDEAEPHRIVRELLAALPAGSYLTLSHMTVDHQPDLMRVVQERLDRTMRTTNPPAFRRHADVVRFFDGLELVEPGVVHLDEWRPDETTPPANGQHRTSPLYCGVARVP
jgi:O-methyltransferase involved in polyketide biosynthesis